MIRYDKKTETFQEIHDSAKVGALLCECSLEEFKQKADNLAGCVHEELFFDEGKVYASDFQSTNFTDRVSVPPILQTEHCDSSDEVVLEPTKDKTRKAKSSGKAKEDIFRFLRKSARVASEDNMLETIYGMIRRGDSTESIKARVDLSDDLIDDIISLYHQEGGKTNGSEFKK